MQSLIIEGIQVAISMRILFHQAVLKNMGSPYKNATDQFENKFEFCASESYGNQPCMETPFLFNFSGAPWLTQYWTRQLIDSVYSGISPQKGYGGDEDQGLMGALSVLLKMGIFSTNGGTSEKPYYEISSPIFNRIIIHLNPKYYPGKQFIIETKNNGLNDFYIQSAQLNGNPFNKPWIYHSELIKGGKLVLQMGAGPNKSWGSDPAMAPPSMSSEK